MLLINEITEEIRKSVNSKDCDFGIQSMDVSSDGARAVLLGVYQDPDFPEVFIYAEATRKARKINDEGSFVDVPLGKAFWAENDQDIYINRHDCDSLYQIKINKKNYKILSFSEVKEKNDYILEKLKSVKDFFHTENNYKPPTEKAAYDNKYREFAVRLINDFKAGVQADINLASLLGNDEEAKKDRLKMSYRYRGGHYGSIKKLNQELKVDIDLKELEEVFEKLKKMADIK
jgi:hypothetical protein